MYIKSHTNTSLPSSTLIKKGISTSIASKGSCVIAGKGETLSALITLFVFRNIIIGFLEHRFSAPLSCVAWDSSRNITTSSSLRDEDTKPTIPEILRIREHIRLSTSITGLAVGTMGSSSPEASLPFLELLDQQYTLMEEYANAQTLLYNASTNTNAAISNSSADGESLFDEFSPSKPPTIVAIERLEEAKWKLRSNLRDLHSKKNGQLQSKHLALSERVINTIANNPAWHSNGLPNDAGRNNFAQTALEANTVAIAALNASIARIKDIEGKP